MSKKEEKENHQPASDMDAGILAEIKAVDENHESWSAWLAQEFARDGAVAFALGGDVALEAIQGDIDELSAMPRGAHIGELIYSRVAEALPQQFMTRYYFEFLYKLAHCIRTLRRRVRGGKKIICHTVLEEIAVQVIFDFAGTCFTLADYAPADEGDPYEIVGSIIGDCDIDIWLYSTTEIAMPGDVYHFDRWDEPQFNLELLEYSDSTLPKA